jgi:hypothetical protein
MPDANSWNVISDVDSDQVVLGIDFPVTGRAEADFAELMTKIGSRWPRYRFLETVPPDIGLAGRPSPDAYTGQWVQDVQQGQWQVVAVLGYCVGGVLAARVCESISQRQPPPQVILFDPQFSDERLFRAEAYRVFGLIKPFLTDDKIGYAKERIDEITGSGLDDMTDIGTGLVELYREMGSVAFAKLGLDDTRQKEMVRIFESYMSWLSAASRIDPTPVWRLSSAIMSADYVALAGQDSSVGAARGSVGHQIPVEARHGDLLRSDSVVEMVLGCVRPASHER